MRGIMCRSSYQRFSVISARARIATKILELLDELRYRTIDAFLYSPSYNSLPYNRYTRAWEYFRIYELIWAQRIAAKMRRLKPWGERRKQYSCSSVLNEKLALYMATPKNSC